MKITGRLAALAVALAGLAVMGADPPPMPPPMPVAPLSHEALAAKLLPTPRLFKMEMTRQAPPMSQTMLMCMGAETLRATLSGVEARRAAAPTPAPDKGCTHSHTTTADGWTKMDRVCDAAAGAARTLHSTSEFRSDMTEFRTRVETQTKVGGTTRTVVQTSRTTMLGACPADLKPGQMREPDGKVVDFGGTLPAAAKP